MTRIHKLLFFFFLFSTLTFLSFNKTQYKLLIYATINDSLTVFRTDTSWLSSETCIKLNIDTIELSKVKVSKKKNFKNYFEYKDHYFLNDQLYDLDDYSKINNFKIYSFITVGIYIDNYFSDTNNNCINSNQKKMIRDSFLHYKRENKKCKIYFEEIKAISDNNVTIDLNSIICEIQ